MNSAQTFELLMLGALAVAGLAEAFMIAKLTRRADRQRAQITMLTRAHAELSLRMGLLDTRTRPTAELYPVPRVTEPVSYACQGCGEHVLAGQSKHRCQS